MGRTFIDKRGRIVIPKRIRDELNLRPDQPLTVESRSDQIVIRPAVDIEKFISELKGCISGSVIEPLELKKIWGAEHAHH
ncbi:MAG: AbrB/MazE/SpoVT family DNA-binding domain-containing protein [Candidatus Geothermarchaeales archaeon]